MANFADKFHVKAEAFSLLFLISWVTPSWAVEIETNSISMDNAPAWVKSNRVEKVVEQIQSRLEWDIRKVKVTWYSDQPTFEKLHGFGPAVLAFARQSDNSIQIGPRVTDATFDGIFGHELVHVILYQKYKGSVPKWLEEGLANYTVQRDTVDYKWLASQPEVDVHTLVHPFKGYSSDDVAVHARYHYAASKALVELIASKCDLSELLQLSVGSSKGSHLTKLETYLSTFCGIDDINVEFRKWIKQKSTKNH